MSIRPGPIVLLGSGETSPNIRKVYDELFQTLETPVRIAILETPAGFEPNSDYVARQIGDYLEKRLQNYRPQISIVPARKRGTPFSPDDATLLPPLYDAQVLLVGPGSPTYAARQLRDSLKPGKPYRPAIVWAQRSSSPALPQLQPAVTRCPSMKFIRLARICTGSLGWISSARTVSIWSLCPTGTTAMAATCSTRVTAISVPRAMRRW